ncbi:hypothetical protein MACJ_003795 [Theileria orientalis]|uniref:Plus3 domain-containing protein n=1 Tax=Theileria orientalis TaxID=68886 RepID=A0A976XJZ0_THEOR|nr:hypothetical protein MACJ_003795 [Theileria orientalis]
MKDDLSDISSAEEEGYSDMPEFKREQILAERHAEQLKKKQRRNLIESSRVEKDESIDELDKDLDYLDDIIEETLEKPQEDQLNDKTLFNDDVGTIPLPSKSEKSESVKHVTASLANAAKVSKSKALNILEHPNYNEYISGTLMNVYISVDSTKLTPLPSEKTFEAKSLSETFPKLIGKHVVFQVESALKCEKYDVHGTNYVTCDHRSKNLLGRTEYLFCGRILNVNSNVFNTLVLVSVNDVCNMPFYDQDITFGDEDFAQFLKHIANNMKSFTFTDEDVQMILEKKLLDRTPSTMGRKSLISEIQRYSHEIELLMEAARNDPSQIARLKEHERKKQELVEKLNRYNKPAVANQYSVKTSSLLCASDDLSSKGVMRKTTKPTPMIMGRRPINYLVPNVKDEETQNEMNEMRNIFKRTLNDLKRNKQQYILDQYLQHVNNMDMEFEVGDKRDYFTNFTKVKLTEFLNN